jgi:hypothetical protein
MFTGHETPGNFGDSIFILFNVIHKHGGVKPINYKTHVSFKIARGISIKGGGHGELP